jgi:uncharacterized protein (DUF983 family)
MADRDRDLRWRCPHCGGGYMSLASAEKHLTRRHSDCWSCELEKHLVQMIRQDIGNLKVWPQGNRLFI